jgi:hypothetical protein
LYHPSSLFRVLLPVLCPVLCLFLFRPLQEGLVRYLVAWFFLPSYCLVFTTTLRVVAGDTALATPFPSARTESSLEGEGAGRKNLFKICAVTMRALDGIISFPYTLEDLGDLSARPTTIFIDRHGHPLFLLSCGAIDEA